MTDLSKFFKKSIGLLDCLEVFCCCWTLPEDADDDGADVEVLFEVGADAAELPDVVFVGDDDVDDDDEVALVLLPLVLLVLFAPPDDVLLEGAVVADEEDELVLFVWANELPIVPTNTERSDANAITTNACLFKFIENYYYKVIFKIYI